MKTVCTAMIATVVAVLVLSALTAFAADPVRMAILPGEGERAPAAQVIAQLEVALTETKDIALLERAEVRKILAEQKLSASGLSNPATALALGKLIPVELFFFIERVPKTTPPICRIQVIEARTGTILAGDLAEEKLLGEEKALSLDLIRQGARKQAVPVAERHYLGLLGVRNEEPGHALDGLAEAMSMFLATDLAKASEIIVLDRDHLQWLTQEKTLTDIVQQLRVSSTLIEGTLRHGGKGDKLELKLALRPLGGGAERTLNLALPQADVATARRHVIAAMAQELKTQTQPEKATAPAAEASLFLKQAQFLSRIGYVSDALRATEAAFALNPNAETRVALARALNATVLRPDLLHKASEAEQVRALNTEIRCLSLMYEQYRISYPLVDDPDHPPEKTQGSVMQDAGLGLVFSNNTGEVRRLEQEVANLQRQVYDHFMAYCGKDFEERQYLCWGAINGALNRIPLDPKEGSADLKIQGIRQVLQALTAVSKPRNDREWWGTWTGWITSLSNAMQFYHPSYPPPRTLAGRESDSKNRAAYVKFYREMQGHSNPMIRFLGYGAFVCMGEEDIASAQALRKLLLTDLAAPEFVDRSSFLVWRCVCALAEKEPAALSPYCQSLMGSWLGKGGDGARVVGWGDALQGWMQGLERAKKFDEADAVAEHALAALQELQERRPNWNPVAATNLARWLDVWRLDHAKDLQRAPALAEPWPAYTLKALPFKSLPSMSRQAVVSGDRLYSIALESSLYQPAHNAILVVHRFPEGGEPVTTITFDLPKLAPDSVTHSPMTGMAVSGETVYVGTVSDGLIEIALDKRTVRKLTEADGLPANGISALAWYDGNLYLGLGGSYRLASTTLTPTKDAFAVYDPKTGKSRILACSADRDAKGPVKIACLMPDEKRKCLWIGAPDYGLCRYDPKTGLTECKIKAAGYAIDWFSDIQPLPGNTDGILMWNIVAGMVLVNLDTLESTWLKGHPQHPAWGCKGAPLLGPGGEWLQPAFYTGEDLITGNTYLTIHSKGRREAPNPAIWWPHTFVATREGVFMISNGKGMLLQKKTPSNVKP